MTGPARRMLRITCGFALLVLGLAGLILPVLQGWLLIGTALLVLRKDIPLADRACQRYIEPAQARLQAFAKRMRNRWRERKSHPSQTTNHTQKKDHVSTKNPRPDDPTRERRNGGFSSRSERANLQKGSLPN